jgi:hypothetical protein
MPLGLVRPTLVDQCPNPVNTILWRVVRNAHLRCGIPLHRSGFQSNQLSTVAGIAVIERDLQAGCSSWSRLEQSGYDIYFARPDMLFCSRDTGQRNFSRIAGRQCGKLIRPRLDIEKRRVETNIIRVRGEVALRILFWCIPAGTRDSMRSPKRRNARKTRDLLMRHKIECPMITGL